MELIPHNLSLDFVGKRKFFIVGSLVINLAILIGIAIAGFNWGVDFAGGSEIEVKFDQAVSPADVRRTVEGAGFTDATVQVIGAEAEHSFLIRVGRTSLMTKEQAAHGEEALRQKYGQALTAFDFNPDYGDKIELRFKGQAPSPEEVSATLAAAGIKAQKLEPTAGAAGYSVYTSGISDKVKAALDEASATHGMAKSDLQRVEFVGPQVGKQLRNRGLLAVVYAAIAILAYVALRFDTRFAPGAVVSMVHDIIVVLGYYLISRREFNLTSVAVLLTIVGYSINDTIVVYDRIRENMAKMRGMGLGALINTSINETLSRTILTSVATGLSLIGLLIFGVGQIWDFAAAMLIGIVTGTYSSIFIASPTTLWLEEITGKADHSKPHAAPAVKVG